MPIQILLPNDIIDVAPAKETDGADAQTIAGTLSHQAIGGERPCFIKFYNHAIAPRGLINEMAGYILAESLGMKVPDFGGLVLADRAQFAPITAPGNISSLVGWYTTDAGAVSMKRALGWIDNAPQSIFRQIETRAREILAKSEKTTQAVIAIDMLMANVDRNLGNILMTSGAPTLIDHGRIVTGNNWRRGDECFDYPGIALNNTIADLMGINAQRLPYKHAIVLQFERLSVALGAKISVIADVIKDSFGDEDTADLMWFILERSKQFDVVEKLGLAI